MLKTIFLSTALIGIISFASLQPKLTDDPCSIHGKVSQVTNETIPFATIGLYKDSVLVTSTSSDINGDYCLKNVPDGKYTLQIACIGYEKYILKNISVSPSSNTTNDVKLIAAEKFLKEVVVVSNNATIVSQDKMESINSAPLGTVGYSYTWSTGNSKEEDFNTEEYGKINDNEFKEAKRNPLSTFSIDVDRASYSNVRRFITQGSLPPADAVRVEEMINYFSYNYPQPEGDAPFSITTEYTECPWNKKHNLIHIGMQGKQVKLDNMPANNLVFLIDVSGSMDSPDKLPLLKSGLRLLVEQMRPQDKIAIVVYAGNAGTVLPSTSGNNKDKIIEALDNLEAGGSTAGGEGIILAYKTAKENFLTNGNNRVILATDGDFNVGVSSDGELTRMIEKKREDGIFLTVLGFGTGNIKDSKMEQLADKGNGNYAYVDNLLEAKKVLVKEMGGTLLTIAKDVKLQIEFNPSKVKGYRLVGYENRLLNNEDFNDDKKDAG
ncbi:MAG: YfbK domain-containing protein, partial [Bacteroidia bacterium]